MTVIKRQQQSYNYPNSATASDTESLHLGSAVSSDTESLNNEPIPGRSVRPFSVKPSGFEEPVIKKTSGRKKLRRYQNRCILQTLNEDEEEGATVLIMESYKGPFTRLLENDDAFNFWNDFIDKPENEQFQIIDAISQKCKNANDDILYKKDKPFLRISSKIRRTIKIKKNICLPLIRNWEEDLIGFFKVTPSEVYIRFPSTSFDRLLLHAIAQYHGLKSISILERTGSRSVEVQNLYEKWVPAERFLTDLIAELQR